MVMTIDRVERKIEVRFEEAPARAVRDALKRWGFRFDGARWARALDVTVDNVAAELERAGARLVYVERTRDGERRLERRLVGSSVRLVPVEGDAPATTTAATPAAEQAAAPVPEPAAPRVIRAKRCWECGRLVAIERRDQAELNERIL